MCHVFCDKNYGQTVTDLFLKIWQKTMEIYFSLRLHLDLATIAGPLSDLVNTECTIRLVLGAK